MKDKAHPRGIRRKSAPPNDRRWTFLLEAVCCLAIGLCIGSLPGCEFTDGNQDVVIGHKLPPVHNHVKVEVDAHLRRDRTDPHHCSCCTGARCLCGKNCTCRCER